MKRRTLLQAFLGLLGCLRVRAEPKTEEWFCLDNCGDMQEFDSEQEALEYAEELIFNYGEDGWSDDVQGIVVGKVTHRTRQTNVVTRDMLDDEGEYNGKHYPSGFDIYCDYEMRPV